MYIYMHIYIYYIYICICTYIMLRRCYKNTAAKYHQCSYISAECTQAHAYWAACAPYCNNHRNSLYLQNTFSSVSSRRGAQQRAREEVG